MPPTDLFSRRTDVAPRASRSGFAQRKHPLSHIMLMFFAFVSVVPFYLMVATSLRPESTFQIADFGFPSSPTLRNYQFAWNELGFGTMAMNSLIFAMSSGLVTTSLGAAAAFGLSRIKRNANSVSAVLLGLMAVPPIILIVPLFMIAVRASVVDTYYGAIIVEVGLLLPFAIYLLEGFFRTQPRELFEAARMDGANPLQEFTRVALPLAKPALGTTLLISSVFAWNDLLIPLVFMPSLEHQTLTVGLANLAPGRTGSPPIPLLMAGIAISVLPLMVLYLFARRSLVRGLVDGAIK